MSAVRQTFQDASRSIADRRKRLGCPKQKSPRHKTPRDCPRVTLRLSTEDHARLKALADGMALSTYIRAKALGEAIPKRRGRSSVSVSDRVLLGQVLGLLGQSRIANNLNQLAYHANIGALEIDDKARAQIEEAYRYVAMIRAILMAALGLKG